MRGEEAVVNTYDRYSEQFYTLSDPLMNWPELQQALLFEMCFRLCVSQWQYMNLQQRNLLTINCMAFYELDRLIARKRIEESVDNIKNLLDIRLDSTTLTESLHFLVDLIVEFDESNAHSFVEAWSMFFEGSNLPEDKALILLKGLEPRCPN